MKKILSKRSEIKILEGVEVLIENYTIKLKGPKGESERNFLNPRIKIEKKENSILVTPSNKKITKEDKMFVNSTISHIKNMISGVLNGYEAKLKICSGHFPISVSIDNKMMTIKNFLGEKIPRKASISDDVSVKLNGDIVTITGCNKEEVGQAAATIERACRINNRDRRLFQDGIWITQSSEEIKK
ncbi:MAG: 50S ribosomal protein L6 [Nanoarchaeota archaeon]|nr:50S ribosomal protein L6 [Nanoarchaeota archaeon]MBU0962697.1 50S ribosomal protein L6 [Nanoarchaeota archaeon]